MKQNKEPGWDKIVEKLEHVKRIRTVVEKIKKKKENEQNSRWNCIKNTTSKALKTAGKAMHL